MGIPPAGLAGPARNGRHSDARRPTWPSAFRPICCAAGPTSAAPNETRPPSRPRSASPRPTSTRRFRSSARSATRPRRSPTCSVRPRFDGTIGPSFNWKILNYGRILNNVRVQRAKFQELVTAYQQTVLNADREAENGLVTFLRAKRGRSSRPKASTGHRRPSRWGWCSTRPARSISPASRSSNRTWCCSKTRSRQPAAKSPRA